MKYQLVLQFNASSIEDFDAMVALEEDIERVLGENHEVDGHDYGSGEMNIFVHTNDPAQALALAFSEGDPGIDGGLGSAGLRSGGRQRVSQFCRSARELGRLFTEKKGR